MSVSWPASFPHPTLQSYSVSPDESIARTAMESGVARQRRRFTSVPSKVKVRWMMRSDIFGLFEAWYRLKAKEGAEWVTIELQNGFGYTSNQARFLKPYSSQMLSDNLWEVRADLEVREMAILSESDLDFILDGDFIPGDLRDWANKLHEQVHITIPTIHNW